MPVKILFFLLSKYMSAKIINGKAVSEDLLSQIKERINQRRLQNKSTPGLAVILVGSDPASSIYVRNKRLACEKVGIRSIAYDLPYDTKEVDLLDLINQLNNNNEINGILVQSPLPSHIDEKLLIENINPNKDVDGFHPYNIGRLTIRQPTLRSCTPFGVIKLLEAEGLELMGLDSVVVGVSNHVGRPMALELLLAGCTVTSCHRHTKDLKRHVEQADLLVVAAGKPGLIKGEWIKEGAIVVDIGINRLSDGKICGDVDFDTAKERAGWITPVPGGVGPMTVATLMANTLLAIELSEI